MIYTVLNIDGVDVSLSEHWPESGGVKEIHAIFCPDKRRFTSFAGKVSAIVTAYSALLAMPRFAGCSPVFSRYYLSDPANQSDGLPAGIPACATSVIGQPPLDSSKINLLVYFQTGVRTKDCGHGLWEARHSAYTHFWLGDVSLDLRDSEVATMAYLTDYSRMLADRNMTMLDNCIRTWFFVRDVDANYAGVVSGRNFVFDRNGLNLNTHYIASTGIGGRSVEHGGTVAFNAYAVDGVRPEQICFLKASTHLNPTMEYGVAFERGTSVRYGDRMHTWISGTASIDNRGEVVHVGDIEAQTLRMWENVGVLLAEAGSAWDDVAYMVVYLRDLSDYDTVAGMYSERFPDVPRVIVLAPVCRSGWLIEMECMAITEMSDNRYPAL